MSHLRPKDGELAAARRRNALRAREFEMGRVMRVFAMRHFEAVVLDLEGRVTVKRPIWPPKWARTPWCQWAALGETMLLLEDVKAIGTNPQRAVYAYRGDPRFKELEGVYFSASKAPRASSRFPIFCVSVERMPDQFRWLITLEKAEKPMR